MKRLILLAAALPLAAQATNWTRVFASGPSEAYIDKASIMKQDGGAKAWTLSTGEGGTTPDGKAYRSVKELYLYTCKERTATLLMQVYYAEPMGKGAQVQNVKYEKFTPDDIVPDSARDGALQVVCHGKQK